MEVETTEIESEVYYSNKYNPEDIYYFDFLNAIIHIIPLDDIISVSNDVKNPDYAKYTCSKFKIINIELIHYPINDPERFKHNMSHYIKNKSYDKFLNYDGPNNQYKFKTNDEVDDIHKVYIFKTRERSFYNNMFHEIYPKHKYFMDGYKGEYKEWNDDGTTK